METCRHQAVHRKSWERLQEIPFSEIIYVDTAVLQEGRNFLSTRTRTPSVFFVTQKKSCNKIRESRLRKAFSDMDYQGEIAPVDLALYCLSFTYEVSAAVYMSQGMDSFSQGSQRQMLL